METTPLNNQVLSGQLLATYFKYFQQFTRKGSGNFVALNRIAAKTLYSDNAKSLDKLAEICIKYNINAVDYVSYCVKELNKRDITVLVEAGSIKLYIEKLLVNRRLEKIYGYFVKSANNIAANCLALGFNSIRAYMRYLITNNLLVNEYVSGNISVYYLCSLHNFNRIIPKMDIISRAEFDNIISRYDKYNVDVQEAFIRFTSNRVKPIKYTENILLKLMTASEK